MRKAGVKNYISFAKKVVKNINSKKSLSLEVFADDNENIIKQAKILSKLGKNVFVKIPIMNTKGLYLYPVIKELSDIGIKLNITAIMTSKQVKDLIKYLNPKIENYISIFSGRIADTGRDPIPTIIFTKKILKNKRNFKIIWASTREIYNIFQADKVGCHIITVGNDFLSKLNKIGYNLDKYSLDTVKTFYNDAQKSGYTI